MEPGLVLDTNGITFDPGSYKSRFVEWKRITGFSEIKIYSQKIIMIHLSNPEELIENEPNKLRKKLLQFNLNNYGAPYSLTAAGLRITYEKLKQVLAEYHEKYK